MVLRQCAPSGTGVVHKDVNLAELGNSFIGEPLDIFILGIVGRNPVCFDAKLGEMSLCFLQIARLARRKDNFCPLLAKRFGDLKPKPP